MKEIKLTQNKVVMVDDIDFEWLNQWKWYAHNNNGNKFYAERMKDGKVTRMHREIMGLKQEDKEEVDHKDGDGLNNQRYNLRICNRSQNKANINKHKDNKSGYKGVYKPKDKKKWRACIRIKNKINIHIGYFNTKEEAALAYDKKAIELFGEFAKTNF